MAIALKEPRLRSTRCAEFPCREETLRGTREKLRNGSKDGLGELALVDQALQFPEVRQIKVDDIRRSLVRGHYRLDANAIAEAMLTERCDLTGQSVPFRAPFATVRRRVQGSPERYGTASRPTLGLLEQLVEDLNQKIGIIMAHTELMNLDRQLDSIQRMHLQVIRREAVRLHNLLGQRFERGPAVICDDEEK